jgi:hypothetical protein
MKELRRGWLLAALVVVACTKEKPSRTTAPSASASVAPAPSLAAPIASGLPDPELVSSIVNPNKEAAYTGPTGTVRGRVVVKGDKAPDVPQVLAKVPDTCPVARQAYGKLSREGPGRALADVLVAVTGYKGYVPERAPAQLVEAKDCFFGTRTIALTFGQRIDVSSKDQTYIPELLGEHGQPQMAATPGNPTPSALYPTHIGRYVLIDDLKLFMTADVIVVKFATHAVTGLDGRFEIPNVPVGSVRLNALLSVTGGGAERVVNVEAGKPTEDIVLEIPFDAAEYAKLADAGAPAAAASSVATMAPSASATHGVPATASGGKAGKPSAAPATSAKPSKPSPAPATGAKP